MKNFFMNKVNSNKFYFKYSKQNKLILLNAIGNLKNIVRNIHFKFNHEKQFDWLNIFSILILGYALMRSGTFLFFYLLIWNIYPASQYFIIYNPISFEIYLLLLSFFIAWYSLRLLLSFPKQFQIHLWIFQRVILDNLEYFSERYIGKNFKILEMFWIFLFFIIICCWPKYGLFIIWVLTICIELYCFDNVRKPQILLFTPKWVKYLEDVEDGSTNELAESDDILPEEDYSMTSISPMWALWEHEEDTGEPQNQPISDLSVEDFEAFFAEYTFIPPVSYDFYEDELNDGWVNWFWLNFLYKILPILCFFNIIICFLFFIWGIPELFYIDMGICDLVIQDFLAEYQRMLLIYTNLQWSSSWKWLIGGLGFRSYFQKYAHSYFNVSGDIVADNLLEDYKKYSKYIYYLNHELSRKGRVYSQLFPFYYEYTQIKNFFSKLRDFADPLRETYLHKFFFYDDLFLYQQLYDLIPISRSKRGISRKKKQEIMSWLLYKSKTWAKDYYYTMPAAHIFPEKHFFWLDLLRILFVIEELDLSVRGTFVNLDLWFSEDPQLEFDPEFGQHYLEHFLYDFGDPQIWLDYDAYEFDNDLYTMLKHPAFAASIFNYFGEAHPLMETTVYTALTPSIYGSYQSGKVNPEPDYITQEFFDLQGMKFGKFTYSAFDVEIDPESYEKIENKYNLWIDPDNLNMFNVLYKGFDWNLEFEDEDSELFRMNFGQTNDYEILYSYYHQANLDILPDLLQDMDPVQLQNSTFFSYLLRNDSTQYPTRKRSFLYNQMLQTFSYAAAVQRYTRYNIADMFELIETTPNIFFGQSHDFRNLYAYGRKSYISSELDKKYLKGYDSRATRSELFKNLNEASWYKYYYKVDTIMDYYDYMPSYRKFFMKTWPLEYIDSPYNFFGKINTININKNAIFLDDGWIIYIPQNTDLLFTLPFNSVLDQTNLLFDPLLFI
jgi:hypothetical protein